MTLLCNARPLARRLAFGPGLLAACLLAIGPSVASAGPAHPPRRQGHAKDFYQHWAVHTTLGHATQVIVPFDLENPIKPATLSATGATDDGRLRVRLKRYLPDAKISTAVEPAPDDQGSPAVHVELNVVGQPIQRWLVADDPQHGQLPDPTPLTYIRLPEGRSIQQEVQYLKTLASPGPTLLVNDPGGQARPSAYPIREGQELAIPVADGTLKLRVKRLFRDFYMDAKTGEMSNRTMELNNPAAVLEVQKDGKTEEAVVIANLPTFSRNVTHGGRTLGLKWVPDQPRRGLGQMVLVDRAAGPLKLVMLQGEEVSVKDLVPDTPMPIGGPRITLKLLQRLPSAQVRVEAENRSEKLRNPTVLVEVTVADQAPRELWIPVRQPVTRSTPDGTLRVQLGPRAVGEESSDK